MLVLAGLNEQYMTVFIDVATKVLTVRMTGGRGQCWRYPSMT